MEDVNYLPREVWASGRDEFGIIVVFDVVV